ncbi:MAG TPA: chromate efflux transporter [Patescibacteria group bacterium]|nr:chromate efflux transporter [Patescibacteria group bacterium]
MPEVFRAFLWLGLTAFGGPIAHIGYFRDAFVRRRDWLDEAQFAQLLAVCQLLPGPASSQMGFAIGLLRAGWTGAVAAFVAFTLPSAALMFAFAMVAPQLDAGLGAAAVHGLKLVAVVIVGHALFGMTRQLAPDGPRRWIALIAALLVIAVEHAAVQLLAIITGAGLGLWLRRPVPSSQAPHLPARVGRVVGWFCLFLFTMLLVLAFTQPATGLPERAGVAAAFYRAGALVFGGGHVVLPLLQQALVEPGWLSADLFLSGYGAAQAVPGPMFSLAAFVGASLSPDAPSLAYAAIALFAVFLPGFLLLLGAWPFWTRIMRRPDAAAAVAGINAAVIGLLAAAFIDPVCRQGVRSAVDVAIVAVGFGLIAMLRRAPLWVVAWCVAAAMAEAAWPL